MESSFLMEAKPGSAQLREAVRRRAEEIYQRGGRLPGRDSENWSQAEREIRQEHVSSSRIQRTAILVRVEGVVYVGEYDGEIAGGYAPGEFGKGDPVPVRFQGNRMFVKRPNGTELETIVVEKTG